jgi:hypothetical protein
MNDVAFDTVAKAAATTRSRRGTLRLIGGAISLALSLSGTLWAASRDVAAKNKKKKRKKKRCDPPHVKCGKDCCHLGHYCCGGKFCCLAGAVCCSDGSGCCPEGMTCCSDGLTCCPPGYACCDGTCCPQGQTCSNGVCCTPCGGSGGPCCEQQFEGGVCCQGRCHLPCPAGTTMDPDTCQCKCSVGSGHVVGAEQVCCPPGQSECGGQCCPTCGCENDVCTNNWYMCGPEGDHTCCFQGYTCCPDQPFCCDPGRTCNPTGGCKSS